MKKLFMALLFLTSVTALRGDEAADYQNFVRAVQDQKDLLVANAKRVSIGFSFSREEGVSDEEWRKVIDRVADILNTTAGDSAMVERSLDLARSEMPQGVGLSYHVGFSDTK
jgi:hypothetical protein